MTVGELARREGIPTTELVQLSRGEFVCLQQEMRDRLSAALKVQQATRRALYRFKSKAAQHLDAAAPSNQDAERVIGLLQAESLKMQDDFELRVRHKQEELEAKSEEQKNRQQRLARQRLRAAVHASRAATTKAGVPAAHVRRRKSAVGVRRTSLIGGSLAKS